MAQLSNLEIRMYRTHGNSKGFHTKGYIFDEAGTYKIIVGSANLTQSALSINQEWNTKVVAMADGAYAASVMAAYNALWDDPATETYEQFKASYTEQYEDKSQKLKELQQEQAPEQVDVSAEDGQENAPAGFSQGIQAKTVQIDVEALRREALEKAAVEADEITSTAKEDAERIRGEAEEKARTLYEEQKKLGYEEGARCREEELNREHEKAMESLHAQKKQLEEQYHEKMSVMEKDIVDAVIQVFDKVFKIQFEEKRELLLQLVNGALLDIDPGDKIRIHTNRSDEEILKEHLAQMQDIVGKDVAIEFVKDNKLSDGQCKIETPYGVVDCGVDTQLSALLKDIRSLV
mgnify:CR=1 FL=1